MEIRALVERDLPQIKELDLLTFPPEEQYGDGTYVRMLQSGLSRVAIEINRVVGYAFVQINPYTHVRSLAVHPAFRRRGYGTALLRAVINEGLHEVDLLVDEANLAAVRLYETLGFQPAEMCRLASPKRRMILHLDSYDSAAEERRSVWTDARLSCLRLGGAGPVALLVHGLYGRATEWRSTAKWLCESHEVFALDQRGNGKSEKGLSDFSRDAQVNDVIATLESIGRPHALLVGQSMGGVTAFLAAARRPDLVGCLIVIETTARGNGSGQPWLARWPLPFSDLDAARRFFVSQDVNADVWVEVLEKHADGYWPEFYAEDMRAAAADITGGYDYEAEWSSIQCATLIVGGARSWMDPTSMKEMATARPAASYVCLAGAGHDAHLDAPDDLRRVVGDFLKRST